jgi:hypothetical protein
MIFKIGQVKATKWATSATNFTGRRQQQVKAFDSLLLSCT